MPDGVPEDLKNIVGKQPDTGRTGAQDLVENVWFRRQHNDQMDAVAPVVKLAAVVKGQQA